MTQQTSPHVQSSDVLVSEPCASEASCEMTIGEKIRTVRTEKGMTLNQLANETGCCIETLEKIECNQLTPPVGNLLQISKALALDSGYLFKESSKTNSRVAEYEKRTANYAYTNLIPGTEKKHLKAFIVTLDPLADHEGVGFQHEGEEFNYVLCGEVAVTVGEHVNHLKQGDALHFNAGIRHNLKNTGDEVAKLLVVIYTP
jgi:quercetin dioxygenase-like cupin family protein